MDKFRALNMIFPMFAILSSGASATTCDESTIALNQFDPHAKYQELESYANSACKDGIYPANSHDIGCCSNNMETFSWTFRHEDVNEKIRLVCYAKSKSDNEPLGYYKFNTEENETCNLQSTSLIKTISKNNSLKMEFTNKSPFCIVCISWQNSADFFSAPSEEVNSDEKGKNSGQDCDCGKSKKQTGLTHRISNGTDVTNMEKYPWMVSVGVYPKARYYHSCGGSVVTKRHVLTAGHCTDNPDKDLWILVGSSHAAPEYSAGATVIHVDERIIHEKYKTDTITAQYDVAILVLEYSIPDHLYMPICIPKTLLIKEQDQLTVLGWGTMGIHDSGRDERQLKKAHIKVIGSDTCERIYGKNSFIRDAQICGFSKHHSICIGDSGGPWMYVDPQSDRYNLVGISSYITELCDVLPSSQTAVHYFYGWIKEKIQKSSEGKIHKCNVSI